jgi:hypothetical protein
MRNNSIFTVLNNPAIDSKIGGHMETISYEINKTLANVDSIMLVGSFGRGEGSVTFDSCGDVFPVNDYDIMIITDHRVTEKEYVKLVKDLHEKIVSHSPKPDFGSAFSISVQIMSKKKLSKLLPDISTIDLKVASRVIYGEDIRWNIPFDCEDVSKASAIVLLFNKVVGLVEQIDSSFLRGNVDSIRAKSLVYQCTRTYMEMATALLIMVGAYVPSYLEKDKVFSKIYELKFPQIYRKIPDLKNRVSFFTHLKLFSEFDKYDLDPIELWFSTRRDLIEVLEFCLMRFFEIDEHPSDWSSLVSLLHKSNYKLFCDYLNRTKLRAITKVPPLLTGMQVYDSWRFFRKLAYIDCKAYTQVLFSCISPLTSIYCASLLGLLAVKENNTINEKDLRFAIKYLRQAYPCAVYEDLIKTWNNFRISCLASQKLYFLGDKVGL